MSEEKKKIITEVLNEIYSRINPYSYYEGKDIDDIICEVKEYYFGMEDTE